MKRFLLGVFAACSAVALAQNPIKNGVATELGPMPLDGGDTGRVSAVACSRQNANTLYIGGADAGVWKSTNAGVSWQWVTKNEATTAIGALAVDPHNDNIVYAGTGEANFAQHSRYGLGLLKSIDGGASWKMYGAATFRGRTFSKIVVDPSNSQVLYASIATAGGFPELAAAKNHPNRSGPVGVFKSVDGGVNWAQLAGGLPNQVATDVAIDSSNPQVVYAAIGRIFGSADNGIYKSTDGGSSWVRLGGGLPTSGLGRISVAVAPTQSNRVFCLIAQACTAGGDNGDTLGGYRSDDGGATWTSVPVGSMQATYGWYLSTVAVSPLDPNIVVFGGYSARRSTNGGTTFATVNPPHVDLHAFDFDVNGHLYCGNDGGLQYSANLGGSWSYRTTGLGTIQFYAGISSAPNSIAPLFGGQQDNNSSFRNSAGVWTAAIGGDGGWTAIDPTNPLRMYGEFQGSGSLYRSTNGGASFTGIGSGINPNDRNCFHTPFVLDPNNAARLFYATNKIYVSTNNGSSFTAVSGDVTAGTGAVRSIAVAKSNSNRVYITTSDGLVRTSSNGGVSFATILTGQPGWPRIMREIAIDPADDKHFWLAQSGFGSNRVMESKDAGATFAAVGLGLPDVPVNTVTVDVRSVPATVYAGTDAGLYRTTDAGAHWIRLNFPNVPIIDMILDTVNERLVVGTEGRGMWLWNRYPVNNGSAGAVGGG